MKNIIKAKNYINFIAFFSSIFFTFLSYSSLAYSENLLGFDRASFGSVVLSRSQSVGLQLELSVGDYENEPISNYAGTIFAQIGRSVGRLDVLTDVGVFPCTAFIVSKQYILTNYHCSKGILNEERIGASRIDATQFVAGYTQTGIDEGTKKYTVIPTPVEYSRELDYAVLEVLGNPSEEYGELKLANLVPKDRAPFWVIGHPQGKGKHISREKCRASTPAISKNKLLHTCDTLPGNSGSPVIDAGLQQVVALHHAGIANDSVNAAILMSKILENSRVLAAYKAPDELARQERKTVANDACDALYNAAVGAKACYAYDVYLENCSTHVLAPIAQAYNTNFCKPEGLGKVEKTLVKTCNEAVEQCSAQDLCDWASSGGKWKTTASLQPYVSEAKRRKLSCGVIETEEAALTCEESAKLCTNVEVCELATWGDNEKHWFGIGTSRKYHRWEAKNRGLGCGVVSLMPSITHERNIAFANFPDDYVCKYAITVIDGRVAWLPNNSWATEAKARGISCDVYTGSAECSEDPTFCNDTELCEHAYWDSRNAHISEAKSRGLTCGVKLDFRQSFISQSKLKRQQLQYALKKLNFYNYGIDGLWGKGTEAGFKKFSKKFKLNSETEVFQALLEKVQVPTSFSKKMSASSKPKTEKNIVPLSSITGKGYGSVSSQPAKSVKQRRLMAIRAARLEAMRNLTTQLHSIRVNSRTTLIDVIVKNNSLKATVDGLVVGAKTVRIMPVGSDTYEVVLEIGPHLLNQIVRAAGG